jgi:hypothetical protein
MQIVLNVQPVLRVGNVQSTVFQTVNNQSLAFEYIGRMEIGVALGNNSIRDGGLEREILALVDSKTSFIQKIT